MPTYVGEEPPFEDVIPTLIEGQSTRGEIVGVIGRPAASYQDGMEWVYTDSQINWEIFGFIPTPSGGTGVDYTGKQHFLVLAFDEKDLLISKRMEVAEPDPFRCSEDGICHDGEGHIMRFASPDEDLAAKSFIAPEQRCSVYLFGPGYAKRQHRVELDDENMGFVFSLNSYFFWNLDQGEHEIAVYPRPATITVNCQNSELHFVNFHLGFWSESTSRLELIDADKGRKQISKRRMKMILPESAPHGEK